MINTRADGRYLEGDVVRVPRRVTDRRASLPPWGEVVAVDGGFVIVRMTVASRHHSRMWRESFTAFDLDATARRFLAATRPATESSTPPR